MTSGLVGAPQVWNLGQTWSMNLTSYSLTTPDNITVSLVSTSELLFRVTLPGTNPSVPPIFTSEGTSPTDPNVGQHFTVFVQIQDPLLRAQSPYINISQLPGSTGSGLHPLTYSATNGTWYYVIGSGITTRAGTFYVFANASDSLGLKNTVAFTITLTATQGLVSASLFASPSAPIAGQATTVTAYVSNLGGTQISSTLTFSASGTTLGTSVGTVPGGSTAAFQKTWTPASAGVYLLSVIVNSTGGTTTSATLNITVYPTIVLIAHNVPAGNRTAYNESALLAEELTAAGYPYSTLFVACTSSLTSAMITAYSVAIIDFGSNTAAGCPSAASATDQAAIVTASLTTSIVVFGASAFKTTTCSTYSAGFFGVFGLTWSAAGTCSVVGSSASAATYTGTPASGVRTDGIPGSLTYNKTLLTSSGFVPYVTLSLGATHSFLKVGAAVNGAFLTTGSHRFVAVAGDPALLTTTLPAPASASWGTGGAGTILVYNILGYATGLATSSATGRALTDFGVSQATLVGQSHAHFSTIYVALRENGPIPGLVTVNLLVNGTIALLGGQIVSATATLSTPGATTYVVLSWLAPSSGPYTLAVSVSSVPAGLYGADQELTFNVLNQATVFT